MPQGGRVVLAQQAAETDHGSVTGLEPQRPVFVFPRIVTPPASEQVAGPGYCIVGEAGAFLDPFFSNGVTIALKTGLLAASAIQEVLATPSPERQRTARDAYNEATATLTLALPKWGLLAAPQVGELYLADISVPRLVYDKMGIDVPDLFGDESLVELVRAPAGVGGEEA